MYFNAFPTIKYDPTGSGYTSEIKDIMTRVAVKKWVRDKAAAFTTYGVPNGATPEMVAFYLYHDTEYHWVVLMFNEIIGEIKKTGRTTLLLKILRDDRTLFDTIKFKN